MAESLTSAQTQWCKSCCLTVHCTDFFIDCEFIERGGHSYQIEIAKKNTTPRLLTLASTMQEAALSKTTIPSFTWEYASYLQNALQKFFFSLPSHTNIGQVYHQSWWKPTSMKYSLVYSLENLLHCWRSRNLPWITIICFTNRPKTHIKVLQIKVFCGSDYFQKPIQMSN